jgi:hypothetical protein
MKALLVFLFFGSSGCFLWFALLCLRMIPFDNSKFVQLRYLVTHQPPPVDRPHRDFVKFRYVRTSSACTCIVGPPRRTLR